MKTNYAVIVCFLLTVLSACALEPNNSADAQAIKDVFRAWDKAWNAGNVELLGSFYTADAIAMGPNAPPRVGRDVIRASSRRYFDQFREENHSVVEDLRISGNLAVARGTQETRTSPKAGGNSVLEKAKWIVVLQRQPDGAWKVLWEIYNGDLPLAESRQ
ncbi:MAG: YybH family protein [Terriglobales bacterium]